MLKYIPFKILTKFGFKKIWLEKHGRFIELWGEFNSKVLLSYFVGKLDAMPVTASEMKSLKQGSKEWKEAIKAQQKAVQDRVRFQVKVETKADADAFLNEMREGKGMDRYRNHKHKILKYIEGYEVHQAFDRFPEADKNHAGVMHIKYYSNGTDGHIFFESL